MAMRCGFRSEPEEAMATRCGSGGDVDRISARPPRRAPPLHPPPPPARRRRRAHQPPLPPLAPRVGPPPGASPHLRRRLRRDAGSHRRRAERVRRRAASRLPRHRHEDTRTVIFPLPSRRLPLRRPRVPGHRVSSWLRSASRRLAGSLHLALPSLTNHTDDEDDDIVLPQSERVKAMFISLSYHKLQIPLSGGGGAFAELVTLIIAHAHMDSADLQTAVSSCGCPRLKTLKLGCVTVHGSQNLSIRSDSLEELCLNLTLDPEQGRIQVTTPNLTTLSTKFHSDNEAYISAAMLSKLHWLGYQ
ncbi:hypothetical protein PR202_ga11154 [Eleusine coracana subsp. coracana]|uniref:F-box/LRR-repeat protein 15/At3g58940/PEG3-like LRR domain-containing protein n=1 Tax=Eleusine coracana subsp. coracana TaxID=191504 RepID=A0AAV5C8N0_ELECO|nr:hypothetical protein PR202_ga11154 [Eleusine coracana subsp. coracana]